MIDQFRVHWEDSGREPQCEPDPNWPNGKPTGFSIEGEPFCVADLPYPAKRCGVYIVHCTQCGLRVGVTTAGRPDDPTNVTMPCKRKVNA